MVPSLWAYQAPLQPWAACFGASRLSPVSVLSWGLQESLLYFWHILRLSSSTLLNPLLIYIATNFKYPSCHGSRCSQGPQSSLHSLHPYTYTVYTIYAYMYIYLHVYIYTHRHVHVHIYIHTYVDTSCTKQRPNASNFQPPAKRRMRTIWREGPSPA